MWTRLLITSLLCVGWVAGDADAKTSREWRVNATAYFWLTGFEGDLVIDGMSEPVDLSFSDFFKDLSWGASAHVEAKKLAWSAIGDIAYRRFKPSEGNDVTEINMLLVEGAAC